MLEIGMGTGKNLLYYNHNKVDLTAVDISEGMLARAKEKARGEGFPVKFKLVDSEKLPFKNSSLLTEIQ